MAISLLSAHMLEQGILTTKLAACFEAQFYEEVATENRLLREEQKVKKTPSAYLEHKVAFVPDHLAFGCQEGIEIFKVTVPSLQSFIAIRNPDETIKALGENQNFYDPGNSPLQSPYCQLIVFKEEGSAESRWVDWVVRTPLPQKGFERLAGYQEFKSKNQTTAAETFGLWDRGTSEKSILLRIDDKTHAELARFELPFAIGAGMLTLSDVYYKDEWHTVLIAAAKDRLLQESLILVFDITDRTKPLEPVMQYPIHGFVLGKERALVVRLSDGRFGVMVGGSFKNKGSVQIILFDQSKTFSPIFLGENSVTFLTAIDLKQQGFVDRIYAADKTHLWALDVSDPLHILVRKLANLEMFTTPLVIQDAKGKGVRIYGLGRRGFLMVLDPLKLGAQSNEVAVIAEGDFSQFFVRFGYFFLIPQDRALQPWVIALPDHQRVWVTWQTIYSQTAHSTVPSVAQVLPSQTPSAHQSLLLTKLLWDPNEEREILLTLNSSCQLNILVPDPSVSKYGRILWRKIQDVSQE